MLVEERSAPTEMSDMELLRDLRKLNQCRGCPQRNKVPSLHSVVLGGTKRPAFGIRAPTQNTQASLCRTEGRPGLCPAAEPWRVSHWAQRKRSHHLWQSCWRRTEPCSQIPLWVKPSLMLPPSTYSIGKIASRQCLNTHPRGVGPMCMTTLNE